MDGIKRVKGASAKNRRQMQKSTTLNRRFVKQPTAVKKPTSAGQQPKSAAKTGKEQVLASKKSAAMKKQSKAQSRASLQMNSSAKARAMGRISQLEKSRSAGAGVRQLSSKELKERAIEQALRNAKTSSNRQGSLSAALEKDTGIKKQAFWKKKGAWATILVIVLAFGAIGTFVYLNLPDLTVKVAALRNGFDGRFPSYLPSGYESDGISSADGKITMKFRNGDKTFSVIEEKSTWDSATVQANLVEKDWGDDYEIMKGQGLTIYVAEKGSAWVNGGILYKIMNENSDLSKEQIHGIAVSL